MDNPTRNVILDQCVVSLDAARRQLAALREEGTLDPAAWKHVLEQAGDQLAVAGALSSGLLVQVGAELRGYTPPSMRDGLPRVLQIPQPEG